MTIPTITTTVDLPQQAYEVVVGARCADHVANAPVLAGCRRLLVVTQEPIRAAGHVAAVVEPLTGAGFEVHEFTIPDGEAAKNVDVLADVWRAAAQIPLTRADAMIAIGGGVVGDLVGFAAASFNRGIRVVQVPTTLLAQVDAAVGGKTGINLPEGKNLVGAFHQPSLVVCDVATLDTLPARVRIEGFGEIIKYGLIRDPNILTLIEQAGVDVMNDRALVHELVNRSVRVKADVVAGDEREHGQREHLNFGHTFAHALESLTGYEAVLHGEAVAVGMLVALHIGIALGNTPPALLVQTQALLGQLGLPTQAPRLDRDQVWRVMQRDKKARHDGVRFVVLDDVGSPMVVTPAVAVVDDAIDAVSN